MRIGGSRRSDNVQDYRGRGMGGGGGMKFGLGTVVVLVIGYFLGINPLQMLGLMQQTGTMTSTPESAPGAPTDAGSDFIRAVLGETEDTWSAIFQQGGAQYAPPTLALFADQVRSGCGAASAASGPFYCPADRKIYIDLTFYDQLAREFQAPGDFAQAYVLAHEVGHHVQTLLGTSAKVREAQSRASETDANQLQVRMELQADCYAGIWAHHADRERIILEPGDIEEGLAAASAVGDDTIQKRVQGHVQPDSFTHGSAEQRVSWFKKGFETGDVNACDTFRG